MDKYNFEGKKIKSFSRNCNIELNFFENLSIEHDFTSKKSEFLKIIFLSFIYLELPYQRLEDS